MRVIAGKLKGLKLIVPPGRDVRPTADRVREALFSALGDRVADASVLDLFAGSGALGIEALSRGARRAVFVESNRRTAEVLRRNIETARLAAHAQVILKDAQKAAASLAEQGCCFDIVFLDPPYALDLLSLALSWLANSPVVAPNAVFVAEYRRDNPPKLPDGFEATRAKDYGDTSLSFIERA